jgi:hypothetical protein
MSGSDQGKAAGSITASGRRRRDDRKTIGSHFHSIIIARNNLAQGSRARAAVKCCNGSCAQRFMCRALNHDA